MGTSRSRATGRATAADASTADEIRVGVSACLLGQEVRYDGGHKRDSYVTGTLARYFSFVPVCPELDIGLGVPRETLRLVRDGTELRMVAPGSGVDHTTRMRDYARRRVRQLEELGLSGYILKKNSPSCGMTRVRTYTTAGMPAPSDRGLYADALMTSMPLLPVEEEGRLNDPRLRENFVVRVFAFHRVASFFDSRWRLADLVAFHASEKLLLMAHDADRQRALGRVVASAKATTRGQLRTAYTEGFMLALSRPAGTKRHTNTLQHMLGYLREHLGQAERAQVLESIEEYRLGFVPLVVPLTLIRHYVKLLKLDYLESQTYLSPHPKELALRNHV